MTLETIIKSLWKRFTETALYQRWAAHTATVRESQIAFNRQLDEAAAVIGVVNVARLMAGKPPVPLADAWAPLRARQEAAAAAAAAQPEKPPSRPWPGSARDMQMKFNAACDAYVEKHGLMALQEALKPQPTPVPVSDPEPPRRPPGRHYR